MRKILSFFLFLSTLSSFGGVLSLEKSNAVAREFLKQTKNNVGLLTKCPAVKEEGVKAEALCAYHVYNIDGNNGFLIVAGDDSNATVIGYSDRGSFDFAGMPPQLKDFLAVLVSVNPENLNLPKQRISQDDSEILLHTAHWGQLYPYNAKSPKYKGENLPAGCSPVALAQVLHYYKNPLPGVDKIEYVENGITSSEISVDFSKAIYDWSLMPDVLTAESKPEQIEEVSRLIFEAGAACKSSWSQNSTQAPVPWVALQHYYNFDCNLMHRNFTPTALWQSKIRENIEAGRPILMAGFGIYSINPGHSFVIDGIKGDDYMHVNWGWDGNYNGWYDLNLFEFEGEDGGYRYDQQMVCDISPRESTQPFVSSPYICGGTTPYGAKVVTTNDFTSERWKFSSCIVSAENDEILVKGGREYTYSRSIAFPSSGNLGVGSATTTASIDKLVPQNMADGRYLIKIAYALSGTDDWKVAPMPDGMALEYIVEEGEVTMVDPTRYEEIFHLIDVKAAAPLYAKSTLYLDVTGEKTGIGNSAWGGYILLTNKENGSIYESDRRFYGETEYDHVIETITFGSKYKNEENGFTVPEGVYTVSFHEMPQYFLTEPGIEITILSAPDYPVYDSNNMTVYDAKYSALTWGKSSYSVAPMAGAAGSVTGFSDFQIRMHDVDTDEDYLWGMLNIPLETIRSSSYYSIKTDLWPLSGNFYVYALQVTPDGLKEALNPDYKPAHILINPAFSIDNPVLSSDYNAVAMTSDGMLHVPVRNLGKSVSDLDVVAYVWNGKTNQASKLSVGKLNLDENESTTLSVAIGDCGEDFEISLRSVWNQREVTFVDPTGLKPLKIDYANLYAGIGDIYTNADNESDMDVFDLAGLYKGKSLNGLEPGIYIVNRGGKVFKYIIR